MSDTVQIGPWFVVVRPARSGGHPTKQFIAYCAQTPELGSGPLDVDFSFDVYAVFGATADEALAKLKREVLH